MASVRSINITSSLSSTKTEDSYQNILEGTFTNLATLKVKPKITVSFTDNKYKVKLFIYIQRAGIVSANSAYFKCSYTGYSNLSNWSGVGSPVSTANNWRSWSVVPTSSNLQIISWTIGEISTSDLKPTLTRTCSGSFKVHVSGNTSESSTGSSTGIYTINVSLTLKGTAVAVTVNLDGNGGSATPKTVTPKPYPGDSLSLTNYKATRGKDSGSYSYTVRFYDGSGLYDSRTLNGTYPITYTHTGWYPLPDAKQGAWSYTVKSNATQTLYAIWSSTSGSRTPLTLSSIPSNPGKVGYTFTGWDSTIGQITRGMSISSDVNAYAQWTPKTYNVAYNLNGGAPADGYAKPVTFQKTYASAALLEETKLFRFGYEFKGWVDKAEGSTMTPLQPGSTYNDQIDAIYRSVNNANSNQGITLYAKWEPIPNNVIFNYYSDNGLEQDNESYIITSTNPFKKADPKFMRSGDYAFLGWIRGVSPDDAPPEGWSTNQGIYELADNAPKSINPVQISIPQSGKSNERVWGTTIKYYGIWTKTGKYIKIGNNWRKVSMAYVKMLDRYNNPKWYPVTDIWTKTENGWKHEI